MMLKYRQTSMVIGGRRFHLEEDTNYKGTYMKKSSQVQEMLWGVVMGAYKYIPSVIVKICVLY